MKSYLSNMPGAALVPHAPRHSASERFRLDQHVRSGHGKTARFVERLTGPQLLALVRLVVGVAPRGAAPGDPRENERSRDLGLLKRELVAWVRAQP